MTASHQNNALEREKLVATLEMYKKNHGPTDPPSGGELMKNLNNQNAELNTRISALETEIKSRV